MRQRSSKNNQNEYLWIYRHCYLINIIFVHSFRIRYFISDFKFWKANNLCVLNFLWQISAELLLWKPPNICSRSVIQFSLISAQLPNLHAQSFFTIEVHHWLIHQPIQVLVSVVSVDFLVAQKRKESKWLWK